MLETCFFAQGGKYLKGGSMVGKKGFSDPFSVSDTAHVVDKMVNVEGAGT